MANQIIIRNGLDKAKAISFIKSLPLLEPVTMSIKKNSGKRTLTANAQQHVWYKQISEFKNEDIKTSGNACKLDFGLPILLSDEEKGPKVSFILKKVGFFDMTREQQISFMDFLPVTSLLTTKQHNQYRDNMQMYFFDNGLNLEYQE